MGRKGIIRWLKEKLAHICWILFLKFSDLTEEEYFLQMEMMMGVSDTED